MKSHEANLHDAYNIEISMSKSQNSIEGEIDLPRARMKGRITFIYSLYHDHSIKRSVSSRDNRSSRSQHPHVVSRSPFVVIVEVVSGSQRDSNLRGLESLQSRTSHDSPISPFSPLRLLSSVLFHPEISFFLSLILSLLK